MLCQALRLECRRACGIRKKAAAFGQRLFVVFLLKKVKREEAAQRRPAQSERKNRVFSVKRQAVWFETQRVSH